MKIKKQRNNNKKIIFITVGLLVIIGVTVGIFYPWKDSEQKTIHQNNHKQEKINKKASDTKKTNDDKLKSSKINDIKVESEKNISPKYEGNNIQKSEKLTGEVQIIGPHDNKFLVRVTINQLVNDKNGTCQLVLTGSNGQTYTDSAKLIDNPQSSTCYGWDIPVSQLGNNLSGKWSAQVDLNGGGRSGKLSSEVSL